MLANLQTLPSTFTLREGKRLIKVINAVLTDLHNEDNVDKGMAELFVKNPQTNFNESVPVAKTFLDNKELTTSEVTKFAFDQASLKVGSQVDTKKGVVAVLRRILPKSVVQPHLYVDGDLMPLKDGNCYDIIQSIQTAAVKQ